jgi:hypothetical protein
VFTTDNADQFPVNEQFADRESARGKTNWVAGWLDFDAANPDNFQIDTRRSELANEISSPKLLACPSDRSAIKVDGQPKRRIRSYSMNGYLGERRVTQGDERGERILSDADAQPQLVLAMDESPLTLGDGAFTVVVPTVDDPHTLQQFVQARSLPATNDGGNPNMALLDGSVQQLAALRRLATAASASGGAGEARQIGYGSTDGDTLRRLFAPHGGSQVQLFVNCDPPDARLEWSAALRDNWRMWNPEFTLISAGNVKVRAHREGFVPVTNRFDARSDPYRLTMRMDRLR